MFYVVDERGQYIEEFETKEEADRFCQKWNEKIRFTEWTALKGYVIEAE